MITLYRAMCRTEADKTMKNQSPDWNSRYKWYSDDLNWILSRVRDGRFNNSNFVLNRYSSVLRHVIRDEDLVKFSRVGFKELMLDRRHSNSVKFVEVNYEFV